MADIEMSLNDTLELDALIEEWSDPNNIIEDSDDKFNLSGIQTSTRILDPKESGKHTVKINGQELTVKVTDPSNVPDSQIYLHDDWGDNKLQNRDKSATTKYNGIEGVYRPKYSTIGGSPSATNKQVRVSGGDFIHTSDIPNFIDINSKITWKIDFDKYIDDSGYDWSYAYINLFMPKNSPSYINDYGAPKNGYSLQWFAGGGDEIILRNFDDGSISSLIGADSGLNPNKITVTRDNNGTWELFKDGNSQGTSTDTTHTNAKSFGFSARSGYTQEIQINNIKVN